MTFSQDSEGSIDAFHGAAGAGGAGMASSPGGDGGLRLLLGEGGGSTDGSDFGAFGLDVEKFVTQLVGRSCERPCSLGGGAQSAPRLEPAWGAYQGAHLFRSRQPEVWTV
jgi:hypothetical protein